MRNWRDGKARYTNGINNAAHRGRMAKLNCEPRTSNPYKQYEHRRCWWEGWDAQDYDL